MSLKFRADTWLDTIGCAYFMSSTRIYRVLDASLNRAGEGLRVVEDYTRFVLDDPFLTSQLKTLRHEFATLAATISSDDRHAARDTLADVGTAITTESETSRQSAWDVCAASLKRVEQSLRSIEEFGKTLPVSVGRQAESLRYRVYTLEKALDITRSSRDRLAAATLCVLVDGCSSRNTFAHMIDQLVEAGVGMIQLRDKSLSDRELLERARMLVSLTRHQPSAPPAVNDRNPPSPSGGGPGRGPRQTLAIINDRSDIAAAAHADGVHVGQEDLNVKDTRAIVGPQMLIGVSTHNIEQARAAVLDGANYLGAGPTFPSSTKDFDAFAGLEYLRQVATEIRLPTFAIGGISQQNLGDVLATGITRVAVGAAVTEANNPPSATHKLLDILHTHLPPDT